MLPVLGANGTNQVGGRGGVIDIHLAARDAVSVAVGRGNGLHFTLVPLVVGFGDGQGNRTSTSGNIGENRVFLRLGTGFQNGQRTQNSTAEMRPWHRPTSQLFKQDAGIRVRTALAAVFGRNDDAQPTGGDQLRPGFGWSGLSGGGHLQQNVFGVLGIDEPAHRRFQHFLFFGEGQIHRLWLLRPDECRSAKW